MAAFSSIPAFAFYSRATKIPIPERNLAVRVFRKILPSTANYHGGSYIVKLDGRWLATPLLLVLLVVNVTDVVFALDSVPAIFAITREPFIVYSANIFAILGLRALYFLLANLMDRFHYLGVGLGLVLMFVGIKMVVGDFHGVPKGDHLFTSVLETIEVIATAFHEQPFYSLAVVGVLLSGLGSRVPAASSTKLIPPPHCHSERSEESRSPPAREHKIQCSAYALISVGQAPALRLAAFCLPR